MPSCLSTAVVSPAPEYRGSYICLPNPIWRRNGATVRRWVQKGSFYLHFFRNLCWTFTKEYIQNENRSSIWFSNCSRRAIFVSKWPRPCPPQNGRRRNADIVPGTDQERARKAPKPAVCHRCLGPLRLQPARAANYICLLRPRKPIESRSGNTADRLAD